MQQRMYLPAYGRFASPDPAYDQDANEPSAWNLYLYCMNNPVTRTDPDGMSDVGTLVPGEDEDIRDFNWRDRGRDLSKEVIPQLTAGPPLKDVDLKAIQLDKNARGNDQAQRAMMPEELRDMANSPVLQAVLFPMAGRAAFGVGGSLLRAAPSTAVSPNLAPTASRLGLSATEANDIGILREAGRRQGNFGMGAADAASAERLGQSWVGDGYRVTSRGFYESADTMRVYRPPTFKPNIGRVQANFESRQVLGEPFVNNGHLEILYGPGF